MKVKFYMKGEIRIIFLKNLPKDGMKNLVNLENFGNSSGKMYREFNHAVLDVFDHVLSLEEADILINSLTHYNLEHEPKYVKIFEDLFKLNESNPVIVEINYKDLNSYQISRIMEALDYIEKILFIDLIRYNKNDSNIICIDKIEELNLFVKLSTRELLFSIFHFNEFSIVGSFDLSFPIFFKDLEIMKTCSKMAEMHELFLININSRHKIK